MIKLIEWTIFIVLVGIVVIVVSPVLPTNMSITSYVIVSDSMYPTIKKGSIALIKKADVSSVSAGDIIAFTSPNNSKDTIVHRLVTISGDKYITKGDNNNIEDKWDLNPSNILGKVFLTIPYFGYAAIYIKTAKGFLIFIGVPAMMLLALQLKKIKDGIEEEIEKRTRENIVKSIV